MAEVTLDGVDKHYGALQVIFDVSLTAGDGEFVVFVGPSGCGKSTLLRAIAGLEDISSGSIRIAGDDVTTVSPSKRGVAMVFQSYALYPHMSVRANMEFGLKVNKVGTTDRHRRVLEAARILQLEEYLDRKPGQLSGGQRQRVAIGRAIVKEPRVFLFDEPLSNLDAALRVQMRVELENLHSTLGATMIYVTHDQIEAMTLADKIVVLNQGRVEQTGSPLDLYHRPRTRFVAGFIGSPKMNFLTIRPAGGEGGVGTLGYGEDKIGLEQPFRPPERFSDELTFGIRPEHLIACNAEEGDFRAKVEVVEALGSETYIYADAPGGERIIVRAHGDKPAARGDLIGLRIEKGREHLFDADGVALPRVAS